MNYEELAFVNQQLAGMLKSGIPLEGALRQLCVNMQRGSLREELRRLEADLARGLPMPEALGALLLVADYYSKVNAVWTRLKGLMIYPLLVLLTATIFSGVLALILQTMM